MMYFEPIVVDSEADVPPHTTVLVRGKSRYTPADAIEVDVDPEIASSFSVRFIELADRNVNTREISCFASSCAIPADFLAFTKLYDPWKTLTVPHGGDIVVAVSNVANQSRRFRASIRARRDPLRTVVPLSFGNGDRTLVGPGETTHLVARPFVLYRGEVLLLGNAEHFKVLDLVVGRRSQEDVFDKFREREALGPTAHLYRSHRGIGMATACVAQDIVLSVKNISTEPRLMCAAMLGTAAF